jgi:aromatic-L-amino-acid/L-tryptophan decarboxylase
MRSSPRPGTDRRNDGRSAGSSRRRSGRADELLRVAQRAAADAIETAGPRYFGYIPGGGLVTSAAGELFARTVNRFTGLAGLAPGLVAFEQSVIQWAASLFALPSTAGGLLTTGGSQAVLSMMLTARHRRLGDEFQDGVVYFSDQAHHCIRKPAQFFADLTEAGPKT